MLLFCFRVVGADLPDLAPLALQIPNPLVGPPNPQVAIVTAVTNQGTTAASGSCYDNLYFSTQPVFDGLGYLAAIWDYGLAPGSAQWTTNIVQLPVTQSGQYYLALRADAFSWVAESDENNNLLVMPFTFQATPADLAPVALQVPPNVSGPPYPRMTVSWAVTNQGPGTALGTWNDVLYFSTNSVLDARAQYIGNVYNYSPIAAGSAYWTSNTFRIPMVQNGTYYLFVRTDEGNSLYEANTNNNTRLAAMVFDALPPDLAPVALQAPGSVAAPPYPTVSIVWGVTNQGSGEALGNYSWPDQLYFSPDRNPEHGTLLGSWYESGPVPAGDSYWRTNSVQLPAVQSGMYYLIFRTDPNNSLYESTTNNNVIVVPIALTITPSDLTPVAFEIPTVVNGPPHARVTLDWGVTNQGMGAALGYWQDAVFLSSNPIWDDSAVPLAWDYASGPLAADSFSRQTNIVRLPAVQSGSYYLFFQTDRGNNVYESNEDNNLLTMPITFNAQPPDLMPVALQAPVSLTAPPYPVVDIIWGVTNQGRGEALGFNSWSDQLYLSTNASPDGATALSYGSEGGPVPAGGSYWRTNSVRLPVVQSGTYHLIFKADVDNSLFESDTDNNTITVPIALTITPPDLAPVAYQAPSVVNGPPYPSVTLVWGGTNQGTGAALDSWYDMAYISTSPFLDQTAASLDQQYRYGPLPPGGSYRQTNNFRLPIIESGTYYLIFQTDSYNYVYESDETNNLLVLPVTFNALPPDLAPVALQAPGTVTAPPYPTVTVVWGITNLGTGEARGNDIWRDVLFLSTSNSSTGGAPISYGYESGPVPAGGSYWRTNQVSLPITQSGTYYLVFRTDTENSLQESNTNNNGMVVPITFNITPADLAPVVFQVPALINGPPYPQVTLVWGTTNQGIGAALSDWNNGIFLSTNSILDSSATWVQWDYLVGPLPPASTHLETNIVRLPVVQSGSYYFLFQIDSGNGVYESNENNNVLAVPFTFNAQPPDLAPVALLAPASLTAQPRPTISVVWGVTNQGAGEALGLPYYWQDGLYLSANSNGDGGILLNSQYETGPVPAGGSYWRTNSIQLPVLQSGTYYLIFTADLDNNLLESNIGNNKLTVPITLDITPPDLAPIALRAPSAVTAPPHPQVTFVWGVTNQGIGSALGNWTDSLLISTNSVLDSSAITVAGPYEYGPLAPGTDYWRTNTYNAPVTHSGTFYFFFQADSGGTLYESDEANNVAVAQVTFDIHPADLVPATFSAPSVVSGPPNPKLPFSWAVTNVGSGAAIGQWTDQVYLSASSNLDWTATPLVASYEYDTLPPGSSYTETHSATVPVTVSGNYYFIFQTDVGNSLFEANISNNIVVVPVKLQINPPDLAPVLLQAPGVVTGPLNPTITITYSVTNQGTGDAIDAGYNYAWNDQLYLSTHSMLDGSEIQVAPYSGSNESGPVAPAHSYWRTRTVQMPVLTSGQYYLILRVNDRHTLFESSLSNNVMAVPVTFNIQPPDLAPIRLLAPSEVSGPPNPGVLVAWGVTNRGAGGLPFNNPYWIDCLYLSTDTNLDWPGTMLTSSYEYGPLAAGGSYWRTNLFALPVSDSGTYYLVFKTDEQDSVLESDEGNNFAVAPVTFQLSLPDLAPIAVQAPAELSASAHPVVTLVTGVTNLEPPSLNMTGLYAWNDKVFISKSPVLDGTETLVSYLYGSGPAAVGGSYWRTNAITLPFTESGDYFLIFSVNADQSLAETTFTNNTLAVPLSFHLTPPDLAPVAFQAPAVVDGPPNPAVTLVWGVTNRGPGQAGSYGFGWYDTVYVSTNSGLSGIIAYAQVYREDHSLPAGGSYWRTNTVELPVIADGSYYLVFETDTSDNLRESVVSNNIISVPVTFHISLPDLASVVIQAPTEVTGPPHPQLNLVWGVTNRAVSTAKNHYGWYDVVYLSTNAFLDDSAVWLWSAQETNSAPAGGSYWRTNAVRSPVVRSGTYYLLFVANINRYPEESDYDNNVAVAPVIFTIQPIDLAPIAWLVPSSVSGSPWPSVTVVAGVTNQGTGSVPGEMGWLDGIYLSTTPFLDDSAYPYAIWSRTNTLPPGGAYWMTNTLRLQVADSATWYLIFKTDVYNSLYESNEQNNTAVAPIVFELLPPPNLTPLELDAPPLVTGSADPTVSFSWRVANTGFGPLTGQWTDAVYLSTTPSVGWMAEPIFTVPITNSLLPGAGYWHSNTFTFHGMQAGEYFFVLKANSDSDLFEADLDDNTLAMPVRFDSSLPSALTITDGQFLAGGSFQLTIYGDIGSEYILQASTNLLDWVGISNFTIVAVPTYITDPQAGDFQRRFYRVATVPAPTLPPVLTITGTTTNAVVISWPLPAAGWVIERTPSLVGNPPPWTQVLPPFQTNSAQAWITIASPQSSFFYRLHRP